MTNKTAVITGATKGIGLEIARAFTAAGWLVVIGGRHEHVEVGQLGDRARYVKIDVRNPGDHPKLVEAAIDWTGRLDVFINNAGYSDWRAVDKVDEVFWDEMIDTNLKGTFFGCRAAAAGLKAGGSIINISSLAGKRGSANNSVYCASKFGVNGITQALAKELGPRGIRVNAVCPVYVITDGLREALARPDAPPAGANVDSYLREFTVASTALGALPTGEEIGRVCLFLASKAASAVTGQCINVDCGVLPQ